MSKGVNPNPHSQINPNQQEGQTTNRASHDEQGGEEQRQQLRRLNLSNDQFNEQEYNRLAKQHGLPDEDYDEQDESADKMPQTEEQFEKEVSELVEWSEALSYENYMKDWYRLSTSQSTKDFIPKWVNNQ